MPLTTLDRVFCLCCQQIAKSKPCLASGNGPAQKQSSAAFLSQDIQLSPSTFITCVYIVRGRDYVASNPGFLSQILSCSFRECFSKAVERMGSLAMGSKLVGDSGPENETADLGTRLMG